MDAKSGGSENVSSWEPKRRSDGTVEIGVNYWNENSQRMSFDSVSPLRYIELWDANLLKHLYEGKPKPEHLPTRDEVVKFLEKESTQAPALLSRASIKQTTALTASIPVTLRQPKPPASQFDVEARLQMLKDAAQKIQHKPRIRGPAQQPEPEEYEPKPERPILRRRPIVATPVGVFVAIDDVSDALVDACARRVPALSSRNREIALAASAGKKSLEGLTEDSFKVKFGQMCNILQIPKTWQRGGPHSRRGILGRVFARYEQLVSEGTVPESIRSRHEIEQELHAVLKEKSLEEKELILAYAKSLKAGG